MCTAYASPQFTLDQIAALAAIFDEVKGVVEAPAHRGFLVVTLPESIDRGWIAQRMTAWCSGTTSAGWQFATPLPPGASQGEGNSEEGG